MKSVLISIKPQWCEKIASGEKTIEVRKPYSIKYDQRKREVYCTRRVSEKPITFVYVEELKETPPIFHKELKDTNN